MLSDPTTDFVRRLRAREPAAWFELWENFGPVLRGQLAKWGRGSIGPETVADLSQETLTALSDAIDRHDPSRGARFSTWLLAIAHHSFCGEMDRRMAQKRGCGRRARSLDDDFPQASSEPTPDACYAEVQNARRRAEDDVSKARKFGVESFAESLLPVADSLVAGLAIKDATIEQIREGEAIKSMREGMEATLRQLTSALERNKVIAIDPPAGEKFDAHKHQAISMVPSEQEANTVVAVLQKGYTIADRVLRPALVTVAAAK